jgi:hypothetical protein
VSEVSHLAASSLQCANSAECWRLGDTNKPLGNLRSILNRWNSTWQDVTASVGNPLTSMECGQVRVRVCVGAQFYPQLLAFQAGLQVTYT